MQIRSIRGRYFATLRRPDGRKHNINLFTRDETEAHRIAKEGELEKMEFAALAGGASLLAAVRFAGITSAPVEEAIDEYIESNRMMGRSANTLAAMEAYLKAWMKRAGVERRMVNDITPTDIDPFVNSSEPVKYSTRQYRLTMLRGFFQHQIKKNRVLHDPCAEIGVRKTGLTQKQMMTAVTHAFTTEEWDRLYAAAGKHGTFWKFLLVFGRDTALRLSDIVNMEIVNLEADHVRVSMRKTGLDVRLPITPMMREALDVMHVAVGAHLFPDEQMQLRARGRTYFRRIFEQIKREAGVTHGTIRSLRKMGAMLEQAESASQLKRLIENYGIEQASKKLGHTNIKTTTKHYLNES